jgi:hypothetical protein
VSGTRAEIVDTDVEITSPGEGLIPEVPPVLAAPPVAEAALPAPPPVVKPPSPPRAPLVLAVGTELLCDNLEDSDDTVLGKVEVLDEDHVVLRVEGRAGPWPVFLPRIDLAAGTWEHASEDYPPRLKDLGWDAVHRVEVFAEHVAEVEAGLTRHVERLALIRKVQAAMGVSLPVKVEPIAAVVAVASAPVVEAVVAAQTPSPRTHPGVLCKVVTLGEVIGPWVRHHDGKAHGNARCGDVGWFSEATVKKLGPTVLLPIVG